MERRDRVLAALLARGFYRVIEAACSARALPDEMLEETLYAKGLLTAEEMVAIREEVDNAPTLGEADPANDTLSGPLPDIALAPSSFDKPVARLAPGLVPGDDRIGPYEIVRPLGRGGVGAVYLAHDPILGRDVAIKVLLDDEAASEALRERFRREARILAEIRHPHIVRVHTLGEDGGRLYLVMDYVRGETLEARLQKGPMRTEAAAILVRNIAEGVGYLHRKGILHRDLKPANILLKGRDEPVVVDFGVARRATELSLTRSDELVGTRAYMAPEQARGAGSRLTPAADVYSLGAILFHCLAGRPPFVAKTPMAMLRKALTEDPAAPVGTDRGLQAILMCSLAKAPEERYASGRELALDLEHFLA